MISVNKSKESAALVFSGGDSSQLPAHILELRKKIHSQEYVDNAILRIAQVISYHLIDDPDELKFRD